MWEYIERIDLNGPDPFDDWEGPGAETIVSVKKKSKAASTPRKRKKDDDDDDDDDDDRPKTSRAGRPRQKRASLGVGVQFVA
jgi:hypothetical protein